MQTSTCYIFTTPNQRLIRSYTNLNLQVARAKYIEG